jgi:tetratricopeptide (TPR) repeat protein
MNDPSRPKLTLAQHYLQIERPRKALEALDGIDECALDQAEYWMVRASALAELDRHEDAASAALRGLEVSPEDVHLLQLRAENLGQLGRLAEAERAILEALRLSPEEPALLCAYARLLARADQIEKASRLVERAAQFAPEHDDVATARLLLAHLKGEDAHTTAHARALLGRNPDDPNRHYLMGFSLETQGRVGAASRHFGTAAEIDPGQAHVAEAARKARVARHPLLLPLRLVHWLGPAGVWLAAVATIGALAIAGATRWVLAVAVTYLLFCVYSWVAPPTVAWWYRRRF